MNICNDNRRAFSDRLLPSAAAAVVLSAMALPSARATEWYAVYNDTATIRANYTLTESGVTYEIANNGSYNAPTLFATGAYSGTKSLKIGVPTTTTVTAPDGKTTDRFEYEWVQATDSLAPRFDGVERYWGFAFKIIGSKSQAPTNGGIIFAQLWQGSPYAPPIRLDLKAPSLAGNPWPNRLFIQNSDTGQNTDDVPIKLYDSTIPVDVWYTYVVGVRPGYDGTGHIDLWVNGVQVVNYTGKIGYKPYSVGGLPGTNDSLMVKSGVYRNRS